MENLETHISKAERRTQKQKEEEEEEEEGLLKANAVNEEEEQWREKRTCSERECMRLDCRERAG